MSDMYYGQVGGQSPVTNGEDDAVLRQLLDAFRYTLYLGSSRNDADTSRGFVSGGHKPVFFVCQVSSAVYFLKSSEAFFGSLKERAGMRALLGELKERALGMPTEHVSAIFWGNGA